MHYMICQQGSNSLWLSNKNYLTISNNIMKKETYFKKADELYDSIIPVQQDIRKKCETYIKMVLKENNGSLDCTESENMISVTYDGGNHPEYASTAFSMVEGISLDENDNIILQIEDCSEYPIENINWNEVFDVAAFIHDEIDK